MVHFVTYFCTVKEINKTDFKIQLKVMNIRRLILCAILAPFITSINAQPNKEEATLMQSIYGMQKKELIARHIKIEIDKADLFWQMYDEYEIARKQIAAKRFENIKLYAGKYDKLTGTEADLLIKTSLGVNYEFVRLWEITYKKISKSVSSVTAAQFIQAEMFFENIVRQELSLDIPLIGEFDMSK